MNWAIIVIEALVDAVSHRRKYLCRNLRPRPSVKIIMTKLSLIGTCNNRKQSQKSKICVFLHFK